MVISISKQVNLVFFSIVSGLLTGVLFDIYRLIRGFENPNKIVTFVEDILFWIFTAIIVFIFLLFTNYAFIGIYAYVFIGIGIFIYIKLISKYFITFQYKILSFILKIFRIIKNSIVYPFQLIIYKIKNKK